MKYLYNYLLFAYPSTFLYKLYETHFIKIKREDDKITRLLLGEKFLIIAYSTIMAPIAFPMIIGKNLNKLDNKFNNIIDKNNYDKPTKYFTDTFF